MTLLTRRASWPARFLGVATAVIVLSGCSFLSGEENSEQAEVPLTTEAPAPGLDTESTEPPPPTTESVAPEPGRGDLFELLGPDDRIVVQSASNDLSILTFGGVVAGPTNSNANQPVFSDDGSVLAWSQINAQGGGEVVFADVGEDGTLSGETVVATPVVSFYSAFAPGSSDRLAVLGNSTRGVGVAVADRLEGATEVVDQGVPYFFVWRADGLGFVGHVGTSLRVFDIDALEGVQTAEVLPTFRTPALLGDGGAVYVATENGTVAPGLSSIDRIDAGGESFDVSSARSVARFNGLGSLSMSPDSRRLAVVVEGALNDARVVNIGNRFGRLQNSPGLNRGLHVIDTQTDEVQTLVDTPVIAAFWAPNSQLIASLSYDSLGNGRSWVRWTVLDLDGNVVSRSPRLLMSRLYATSYLPFYDQYERSSTPWSPDSTRLVFPGESMAGDAGIWLHQTPMAGEDAQTFLIGDGVMALWSP